MSKQIYQQVNWKDFDKYFKRFFPKYIREIEKFFKNSDKKYIFLNEKFYSVYFFFSISEIIFYKYLYSKKIFYIHEKSTIKERAFKFLTFKQTFKHYILDLKKSNFSNKIIENKFFHRHEEFRKEFKKKINNFKEVNFKNKTITKYKKYKTTYLNDLKKKFTFNISKNLITEIITLEKNFDNFKKFNYPKIFMSSSHGYAHHPVCRLFIAFSKISKTKIFMLQTNFWQGLISFYDFNKYEDIVSDTYFAHGENLNIKKYVPLGSFYSYKPKINGSKKQYKNVIILTQPPNENRNYPKLLSMDWSNTYKEFQENELGYFQNIKNILNQDSNCELLCKYEDYRYYFKKLKEHKINRRNLKRSFINRKNFKLRIYNKVYLTYPSNAIVEHFYAGSEIVLAFPGSNIFLKESYLLSQFHSKNNLSKTIKKYAYSISPKNAFKKIKQYF